MALTVRQMWLPSNKYSLKAPYSMNPSFIVIHNTANDASANNEVSYMIGNNSSTSYHFAVDHVEAVQAIPENRNAWHCGATYGNRNAIGIEICYSASGGDRFIQAEKNTAYLTASLLKKYGWGVDKVKTHQQQSGKYCPHRTLDMGWERFLNLVRGYLGTAQVPDAPSAPSQPSNSSSYSTGTYTLSATLNVRTGPGTEYARKSKGQLSADGQRHANANGCLLPGTVVTVMNVRTNGSRVWGQIPSGWICLNDNGSSYVGGGSSSSTTPPSAPSSSGSYSCRQYTITADALKVRTGAGLNYRQKAKNELSADGQRHANASGCLMRGTVITVMEIVKLSVSYWGRIPSGWICLEMNGESYVG